MRPNRSERALFWRGKSPFEYGEFTVGQQTTVFRRKHLPSVLYNSKSFSLYDAERSCFRSCVTRIRLRSCATQNGSFRRDETAPFFCRRMTKKPDNSTSSRPKGRRFGAKNCCLRTKFAFCQVRRKVAFFSTKIWRFFSKHLGGKPKNLTSLVL